MAETVSHPRFEMFQDARGQYRFRLTAPNSEALFQSEAYATKAGCRRGVQAVREHSAGAGFLDLTEDR
jgi:hypothetical protein